MSPERLGHHMAQELAGIKCRCGAVKRPRQTFCRGCYFLLTQEHRRNLYRRIGAGYEDAYIAAVIHLVAKLRFGLPLWLDPPAEGADEPPDAGHALPWNVPPPRNWCKTPGCLEADGHAGECTEGFS